MSDSTIHLFLTVNVGITGFDNTNNSISIYPNPPLLILISLKNINTATYEATPYDLTGRVLQHQPINEPISRMDLSHIAKGFYFLQIKENNKIYHSIKNYKRINFVCFTMEDIKERIQQLVKELNLHNYNYYTLDTPTISDYDFDNVGRANSTRTAYPQYICPNSPSLA